MEVASLLCSMIAVKTCGWGDGASPAVTSLEHGVDYSGHVDQQDTASTAYSQPDNNNIGSNSLPITSTLANEPDEEAELLKENEATKEKGGKITNFLNKCKDLRLTKKMVKRKLSGKRPPTKTKTNEENG